MQLYQKARMIAMIELDMPLQERLEVGKQFKFKLAAAASLTFFIVTHAIYFAEKILG
jgi:hypothetical protein